MLDGTYRPVPPRPKDFNTQVQDIASAAHKRGVTLMRTDEIVGSVEAADLCRTMRAAHESTRGDPNRHEHVLRLVNGIAARLGAKGPVQVSKAAWNQLGGYAQLRLQRTTGKANGKAKGRGT